MVVRLFLRRPWDLRVSDFDYLLINTIQLSRAAEQPHGQHALSIARISPPRGTTQQEDMRRMHHEAGYSTVRAMHLYPVGPCLGGAAAV